MQIQRQPTKEEGRSQNIQATDHNLLSSFKQQMLKAWLPIPTLSKTIILFFVVSAIFLGVGIPMTILSNDIVQVTVPYDISCSPNQINCSLTFNIPTRMQQPVFVYYQLNNYYQNHRLYTSSISYKQLGGMNLSVSEIQSKCFPIVNNSDLYTNVSINGVPLVPSEPANPCGIVAYTIFNDTFNILYPNSTNVSMTTDDITWPSDLTKYKVSNPSVTWLNISDPRVMNWIRIATLPNFRKLWAKINTDLQPGNYTLLINNTYTVSQFNTKKSFVLSTSNFFGSRNEFLSIIYLALGCICFAIGCAFLVKKCRKDMRIQHAQ